MNNGLPDVPIDAIAIDRQSAVAPLAGTSVYLGTDIGVYQSTDGGVNWAIYNPNNTLPVLPVFDMAFQEQTGVVAGRILRIATHGRGIWEIQTTAGPNPTPTPTPGVTPTPTPGVTPTATPTPGVTPTATPSPSPAGVTSLGNISTRLRVETGDNALIGGFIVTGTQPKRVIVRAIGPSLMSIFPDALTDTTLELRDGTGSLVASNDDWRDTQEAEITMTGIAPSNDLESAIVATLPANNAGYTAIVRGFQDRTGIGVVEAYDLDATVDSRFGDISTRGLVQTGNNVLIAGTIIVGQGNQRLLIRALGPSVPVIGNMANPTVELRNAQGSLVAANDNWRDYAGG